MAFDISTHKWLRISALALALYVVLLPFWWYSLSFISAVAGTCASWIYALLDSRMVITSEARVVQVVVNAVDGSSKSSGLRMDTVTYGWPMLVALVMVTRTGSLIAKLRPLLIGCAVMFVLSVGAVMAWANMTGLQLDQQNQPGSGDRSSFFFLAFHGYAFSQPVVAVLIWLALVMLGQFKTHPPKQAKSAQVPRNAECPCGSGRKYKRCCGR